ncbi:hypothetical protein LZ575_21240 [Antarcticibacterium sp. 1MA-6-2]|nr:hypothetical protein [Antarcticibacterium sp. 1MA-6-2]UJH91130.1 hypothetical protein LZ575_21240 [Antarcticibacterium sp. 1MA-6-2]
MGRIEDNRRTRKDGKDTKEPLSEIGNRRENTNDFDIDEKTIKDQKNKK